MPTPFPVPQELHENLSLLVAQEAPVVRDFCRLATQYFKQSVRPKVFATAAAKLGTQPSQVEDAVQALIFLLIRCAQVGTSISEVQELCGSLGFSDDAAKVLTDTYTDNETDLKEYLKTLGVKVPHYKNLEWRFDILVGSRSLHHMAEPLITMQLSLDTGSKSSEGETASKEGGSEDLVLQTDANNLLHITSVLEDALQEARTHHSRRIQRYLK